MNFEEDLKYKTENPDFQSISGSRLYGTNTPRSDWDIRGFTLPPFEAMIGVRNFEMATMEGEDHKVYSIKYFLQLALQGDPLATEMFYVSGDAVLRCSEVARLVLDQKENVVSNVIFRRIMGYGNSEWRKARGEKFIIEKRTPTEDAVIDSIRNVFAPDKDDMDEIVARCLSKKPIQIVPSTHDLGENRKKEFENFGYGVSCATHTIRLLHQLKELMTTGKMTFPRPEVELLKRIRSGQMSLSEVETVYRDTVAELDAIKDHSVLPNKPNNNAVWDAYTRIVRDSLAADARFKELGG